MERKKNCPICGRELEKEGVQGIIVDVCPSDCGVWLDRGELDDIIERVEEEAESGSTDWVVGFSTGLSTGMLLG